jgi:hypothetical protein
MDHKQVSHFALVGKMSVGQMVFDRNSRHQKFKMLPLFFNVIQTLKMLKNVSGISTGFRLSVATFGAVTLSRMTLGNVGLSCKKCK